MNPNPFLPQLDGPQFLVLYLSYFLAIIFLAWSIKQFVIVDKGRSTRNSSSTILFMPDLYEAAFLRGEEEAVLETAIYRLYSMGYLIIGQNKFLGFTTSEELIVSEKYNEFEKDQNVLPLEREILRSIRGNSFKKGQVLSNEDIKSLAARHSSAYLEKFRQLGYLVSEDLKKKQSNIYIVTMIAGLLPGILRLLGALSAGRPNIVYLILSFIGGGYLCHYILEPDFLSESANQALESLQDRFKFGTNNFKFSEDKLLDVHAYSVAVNGLSPLEGTEFEALRIFLRPNVYNRGCGGCGGCGG